MAIFIYAYTERFRGRRDGAADCRMHIAVEVLVRNKGPVINDIQYRRC